MSEILFKIISKISHYLGVSLVFVAAGFAFSLARSSQFTYGAGDAKINLSRQVERLKKEIDQKKEEVQEADELLKKLPEKRE